ncbi:hypothetical protein R69927_04989 [Paraburkholderia domus]|jgi:nucleotide-binding universal stress UspA family protein|uniref:UspA domain-containing protein n=1 Tax=Paraburkholderia domus TaxID=2793075 RepID=A0A9N8R0X9_9BURK|nr:universal stress protein [Paraburkholderia domus]MBK5052180.1 universal stress protein [Burkholderia sp. R-70006]MBK5064335.1 universal stress protein [Burkholderia sp. R-70199]MBK5089198.1 universal stress protein [Burkholderia sp. R-69927]MBK5122671.1 universal stress protein [Burkholderia sp. R-69980]MBK5168308.1 universal stress protein [Burkholderia sp. R-70211]MBK5183518.1 universal stress protein [Burkholderia sp. R-69749]MCI0149670.1 universal stress protein [Paraburkholderia sedi
MYQQTLVAVDGSETSARARDAASKLARDAGVELQPVFVEHVPVGKHVASCALTAALIKEPS